MEEIINKLCIVIIIFVIGVICGNIISLHCHVRDKSKFDNVLDELDYLYELHDKELKTSICDTKSQEKEPA